MPVLLLNAGSSSLKASLRDADGTMLAHGSADWAGDPTRYRYSDAGGEQPPTTMNWKGHRRAVEQFIRDMTQTVPVALPDVSRLTAVGHRIVHGGEFRAAVQITPEIRTRITALTELAPLHNPPSLEALAAAEELLPDVPHIATFDTAFHATLPPEAYTYPIPRSWTHDWGIRRFGFHGLSHAYCSRRAADMCQTPIEELRMVICHLGHGCSASAVQHGRCVETTMGFTPLDGLMMATRSGSIDPAIITYVQDRHGLTTAQVDAALNRESGLRGVSGRSGDMRQVLEAAEAGDENARLALDIYVRRVRQTIGGFAAVMGGVDVLVFTAGVGEHAGPVRSGVCRGLGFLGLELDERRNRECRPDADVAQPASRGRILVIATCEDLAMLQDVRQVMQSLPATNSR